MNAETQRRAMCCELVSEVARTAGEVRLKVAGASMLPAVWPGDELCVRQCDFAGLQPGQIVLYLRDGTLTAHRIMRIAGDHLIARGDSLPCCDLPVKADEVVGKVVSVLRHGCSIHPGQSFWQRALSRTLLRSEFCTRMFLHMSGRLFSPSSTQRS
jgi:hypothetical protein